MHITTEVDLNSDAIVATNSYSTEFRRLIGFFDVNDPGRSITTDREEFFGRNGTAKNPEALRKSKLSGKTGAALDPCGVIQVTLGLEDGEKNEIVFRLGASTHTEDLTYLISNGRGKTAAREALDKVIRFWNKSLSMVQVDSPDRSLNIMTNGWLNYQTLACRLWARSGYYQSGVVRLRFSGISYTRCTIATSQQAGISASANPNVCFPTVYSRRCATLVASAGWKRCAHTMFR